MIDVDGTTALLMAMLLAAVVTVVPPLAVIVTASAAPLIDFTTWPAPIFAAVIVPFVIAPVVTAFAPSCAELTPPGARPSVTLPAPPPVRPVPALRFVTTPSAKYPLMSMMMCVLTLEKMSIEPLPLAGTMAALPFTSFVLKLSDETRGCALPVGYALMKPASASACTTVRLNEYAAAGGMPAHAPLGTTNDREAPPTSFGPPNGPFALRVSTRRHGTMVMKCEAADGTESVDGCNARPAISRGCVFARRARICSKATGQSLSGTVLSCARTAVTTSA